MGLIDTIKQIVNFKCRNFAKTNRTLKKIYKEIYFYW